jgi:hypothetical protein
MTLHRLPSIAQAQSAEYAVVAGQLLEFEQSALRSSEQIPDEVMRLWERLIGVLEAKIGERVEWEPYPSLPPTEPEYPAGQNQKAKRKRRAIREAYQQELIEFQFAKTKWLKSRRSQAECITINKAVDSRTQIVSNRRKQMDEFKKSDGWPPALRLNWSILPPGRWPKSSEGVRAVLRDEIDKIYRPERILHAQSLRPVAVWRGLGDDFDRYLAFEFETTESVLLESPDEGNAAYVLTKNWKRLSRMTKGELIFFHSADMERIIHRHDSDWMGAIERAVFRSSWT